MDHIPTTIKDETLVEKRREQIVLGAISLFSERGFHKSTLDELAKRSRISHGSIYSYISSKEDIFSLIHNFLYKRLNEEIEKTVQEPKDPIEKLRQLIKADFNLMNEWENTILLLYQESHILKGERLKILLRQERGHIAKYEAVLKECIEKGFFNKVNVRLVANLIKVMLDSWAIKQWDLEGHVTKEEMEEGIVHVLLNGLLSRAQTTSKRRKKSSKISD